MEQILPLEDADDCHLERSSEDTKFTLIKTTGKYQKVVICREILHGKDLLISIKREYRNGSNDLASLELLCLEVGKGGPLFPSIFNIFR